MPRPYRRAIQSICPFSQRADAAPQYKTHSMSMSSQSRASPDRLFKVVHSAGVIALDVRHDARLVLVGGCLVLDGVEVVDGEFGGRARGAADDDQNLHRFC